MAKNVTTIQFDAKSERDTELIRLLNKVARIEHLSPHSLGRQILLKHLTAAVNSDNAIHTQQTFKAAV